MSSAQFQEMVNHASGLRGVAEISSDLRDLLAQESDDVRAAEAVALFCYQVRKWIDSFVAALGGLDTLVFAGGIGENASLIRSRICGQLGFLGIELNEERNPKNASLIPTDGSRVAVRVIRTDEEIMIARSVVRVLGLRKTVEGYAPVSRPVQRTGSISSPAILGGLHHHYVRVQVGSLRGS
jgi:acetate kinase